MVTQLRRLPRIKPAHVVIALHSTVHNGSITLFSDALLGSFLVNPVRITPHATINLAEFNRGAGIICDGILELLVEVAVVKEDIGIMPPPVEVPLN